MADTDEEQLLSDLLGHIAREDARLDAAHLEPRVIGAVDSPASFGATTGRYVVFAVAAIVLVAVLVPAMSWLKADVPTHTTEVTLDATEQTIAEPRAAAQPAFPTQPTRPAFAPRALRRGKPTQSARLTGPTRPTIPTQAAFSSDEFMPLMPLTERDLDGPFQIVRVQMPRASLGTLRSPLEHPNELIEADVLLGEDGMARAIRVSAGGSVYPWRSR